jgi:hypothetical protein
MFSHQVQQNLAFGISRMQFQAGGRCVSLVPSLIAACDWLPVVN